MARRARGQPGSRVRWNVVRRAPDCRPSRLSAHAAGPTDGGFLIIAVWDSRESCDRFVQGTLMAKMPVEGGFEGRPEERAAEVINLQTS